MALRIVCIVSEQIRPVSQWILRKSDIRNVVFPMSGTQGIAEEGKNKAVAARMRKATIKPSVLKRIEDLPPAIV